MQTNHQMSSMVRKFKWQKVLLRVSWHLLHVLPCCKRKISLSPFAIRANISKVSRQNGVRKPSEVLVMSSPHSSHLMNTKHFSGVNWSISNPPFPEEYFVPIRTVFVINSKSCASMPSWVILNTWASSSVKNWWSDMRSSRTRFRVYPENTLKNVARVSRSFVNTGESFLHIMGLSFAWNQKPGSRSFNFLCKKAKDSLRHNARKHINDYH